METTETSTQSTAAVDTAAFDTAGPETTNIAGEIDGLMADLIGIGRAWAAHGLAIGRSSLQTTALTLDRVASRLGELAQRFEAKAPPTETR